MIPHHAARRWCSGTTAAVALLTLTAGCSADPASHPKATATPGATSVSTPDPAATAALTRSLAVTRRLRSYVFVATQTLTGGPTPQRTVLTGRAVRPDAVTYDLAVGGRHQQVIKVEGRTFLRVPPAGWKALSKPDPTVDPLASLLPLLTHLDAAALTGSTLTGTVSPEVLRSAALAPTGAASSQPTPVTLTLDAAGHVTLVSLGLTVKAGTRTLRLQEATRFSQFNAAPPITPPGTIK